MFEKSEGEKEKKARKLNPEEIREMTTRVVGYGMSGCATHLLGEIITEILPAPVKVGAKVLRYAGEGVIFMMVEGKCVAMAEDAYDDFMAKIEEAKEKAKERAEERKNKPVKVKARKVKMKKAKTVDAVV